MRLRRIDDDFDGTLTREEYHRVRDAAAVHVTPGMEALAAKVAPPRAPRKVTPRPKGRRAPAIPLPVAAPAKSKRGRR